MAPFPLTALAEELISVVASHVHRTSDLLNLALVSKQLHRIAIEHLYRHVTLRLGSEYTDYTALHCLVVLFFEKPVIAGLVRRLTIRGEWNKHWEVHKVGIINQLRPIFQSVVLGPKPGRRMEGTWTTNIFEWGTEEALVAMLAQLLPNLAILDTSLPWQPGMHYKWLMQTISGAPSTALPNLRDLLLVFPQNAARVPQESYLSFFRLPFLKRVRLIGVGAGTLSSSSRLDDTIGEDNERISDVVQHRRSSNSFLSSVEHIEIRDGFFNFAPICTLIASCRALKIFSYEIAGFSQHLDTAIVAALTEMHASSLEELCLGESYQSCRGSESDVPDFRKLEKLKHLKIAVMSLFAFSPEVIMRYWTEQHKYAPPSTILQKLPPNLERLTIFEDYTEENVSILGKALSYSPISPPICKQLALFTRGPGHLAFDSLAGPTRERNIKLRIIPITPLAGMKNERGWGLDDEDVIWADVAYGEDELAEPWVRNKMDKFELYVHEP